MKFEIHDILKTILIVWFVAATLYVLYDLYNGYKVKGMQAAYQQGYADSVAQVIDKVTAAHCTPIEIRKGDQSVSIVDATCTASSLLP